MYRKIRMTGAGCVRADRYGTFEIGGEAVQPMLFRALEECSGQEEEIRLAGRLTLTLEVWQQPLKVEGSRRGMGEGV